MAVKILLSKLIYDLPSSTYHSVRNTYSSSQLKEADKNIEMFHSIYIAKTIEKGRNASAFDSGTYIHTGVMEPHKLDDECAVFPGSIRRGEKWDAFEEKHKGKAIITNKEKEICETCIANVKASPIAMGYVNNGTPEVSLFIKIGVSRTFGNIYAIKEMKVLTRDGWIDTPKLPENLIIFIIKVRADVLGKDFVWDLKSTSGNAKDKKEMESKSSDFTYDLSAALYFDMFSLVIPTLKKFAWTFVSKSNGTCKTYRATKDNILVGRAKYVNALRNIASGIVNEWSFPDEEGELDTNYWDRPRIKELETLKPV